ncbi:uncharacterized protein LOC126744073 [Anthonomus grandis grandis]|uniref:uncharacterized protein LOC126744073 n=1 Tax=Anthonomus grandis grandis TaxID=2921223 RepID=UPI0021657C17|nr:uncharacterized protein LOC126744073 [Anthonomus grandis grandis]
MFTCPDCKIEFFTFNSLGRHFRLSHQKDPKELEGLKYPCPHCPGVFRTKTIWQDHIKKSHGQSQRKSHLICPLCTENTKNYKSLINHLVKDHKLVIECEQLEFDSIKKFNSWKIARERDLNVMYVKQTAGKRLSNGKLRTYYHCHRSFSCKAKGRLIRKGKAMGSNKINRACPGILIVTEQGDNVHVIHYATHLGHNCDIGRMNLTTEEKLFIAGKLREGITISQILIEIRASATASNFNRLHLLKKKDIHNIIRDLSIQVKKTPNKNRKKRQTENDKLFDDIVAAFRGDAKTKLEQIKNAHEESRAVENCKFDSEQNYWLVPENPEEIYFIQSLDVECPDERCCVQKCEECDICIHSYKCSCIDNQVFYFICKHIHAVHDYRINSLFEAFVDINEPNGVIKVENDDRDADIFIDEDEIIDGIVIEDSNAEDQVELMEGYDIKAKLELIQTLYENVELKRTESDLVVSHLNAVLCLLSKNVIKVELDLEGGT